MIAIDQVWKWRVSYTGNKGMCFRAQGLIYVCESWAVWKIEHDKLAPLHYVVKIVENILNCNKNNCQNTIRLLTEKLIMKHKCKYFGHIMQSQELLEKNLILGKVEGHWKRSWQKTGGSILSLMTEALACKNSKRQLLTDSPDKGMSLGSWRVRSDWITTVYHRHCFHLKLHTETNNSMVL